MSSKREGFGPPIRGPRQADRKPTDREQTDHEPVFPLSQFFQQISNLLEQGQILFGNIVNLALENPTNLWKYDILCALILDWYEI